MKPTWLIEADVFGEASESLKRAVKKQGLTFAVVKHRPHAPCPRDILGAENFPHEAPAIVMASHPLIQHIQRTRRWKPGPICSSDNLQCSSYYAYFGPFLLNQNYSMLPGFEAIRHRDRLLQNPGNGSELFIRPNSVSKIFTGKVATRSTLKDDLAPTRYDPRTLVVLAEPQKIGREWRAVIANGRMVTISQYRDRESVKSLAGAPTEVIHFIERVLAQVSWRPDPLFMMDICETDKGLFILELNSFSGSGLYLCDLDAVVEVATQYAMNCW